MGKAVYLPFAVYGASDPVHPAHQVWDHSSSAAHSIDLDFGTVVDLAVEGHFLDALADPARIIMKINRSNMQMVYEMISRLTKALRKANQKCMTAFKYTVCDVVN